MTDLIFQILFGALAVASFLVMAVTVVTFIVCAIWIVYHMGDLDA